LAYVSNETRQTKKSQQTEHFGKAKDAKSSSGLQQLKVLAVQIAIEHQKDVVEGNRAEQIEQKPTAHVRSRDLLWIQDDLFRQIGVHDTGAEVDEDVEQKDGVGQTIEGDPSSAEVVVEEGNGDRKYDQVGYQQQQHAQVPIESVSVMLQQTNKKENRAR
jgi:hypothetical protein